jgi:hypothetical protein
MASCAIDPAPKPPSTPQPIRSDGRLPSPTHPGDQRHAADDPRHEPRLHEDIRPAGRLHRHRHHRQCDHRVHWRPDTRRARAEPARPPAILTLGH